MAPSTDELGVRQLQLQAALKAHEADDACKSLQSSWRAACVAVQYHLPGLATLETEQLQALVALLQLCVRCAARLASSQSSVVLPQVTLQYQTLRQLHSAQLHEYVPALGIALLDFMEQEAQHIPQSQASTLRSGAFAALAAALPHVADVAAAFAQLSALCLRTMTASPPQPAWPLAQRLLVTRCQATGAHRAVELDIVELKAALQLLSASLCEHDAAVKRMLPSVAKAASTAALDIMCVQGPCDATAGAFSIALPQLLTELAKAHRQAALRLSSASAAASGTAAVMQAHCSVWAAAHGAAVDTMSSDTVAAACSRSACAHTAELLAAVVPSCAAAFSAAKRGEIVEALAGAVPNALGLAQAYLGYPPPKSQLGATCGAVLALGAALAGASSAACQQGLPDAAMALAEGAAQLLQDCERDCATSAYGGVAPAAYASALRHHSSACFNAALDAGQCSNNAAWTLLCCSTRALAALCKVPGALRDGHVAEGALRDCIKRVSLARRMAKHAPCERRSTHSVLVAALNLASAAAPHITARAGKASEFEASASVLLDAAADAATACMRSVQHLLCSSHHDDTQSEESRCSDRTRDASTASSVASRPSRLGSAISVLEDSCDDAACSSTRSGLSPPCSACGSVSSAGQGAKSAEDTATQVVLRQQELVQLAGAAGGVITAAATADESRSEWASACVPLLLDLRAAALLAHSAPALAALAPALHACAAASAAARGALPNEEFMLSYVSPCPSLLTRAAAHLTQPARHLLAASRNCSSDALCPVTSASMAWLREQGDLAVPSDGPGTSATLCADAELALCASESLQRAHAVVSAGGCSGKALAEAAASLHVDTTGCTQTVSPYSLAQPLAIQACCAAARAHGSARAALKAAAEGPRGQLSSDGPGRWHLLHMLLHSGTCYVRLLRQLGLEGEVEAVAAPLRELCKRMGLATLLATLIAEAQLAPTAPLGNDCVAGLAAAANRAAGQGAPLLCASMLSAAAPLCARRAQGDATTPDVAEHMLAHEQRVAELQRPPLQAKRGPACAPYHGASVVLREDLRWALASSAIDGGGAAQLGQPGSAFSSKEGVGTQGAADVASDALTIFRQALLMLQAQDALPCAAPSGVAAFFARPQTAALLHALGVAAPATQPIKPKAAPRARCVRVAAKGKRAQAGAAGASTLSAWSETILGAAISKSASALAVSRLLAGAAQARLSEAGLASSMGAISGAQAQAAAEDALSLTMRAAQAAGVDAQQLSATCRDGAVLAARLARPALAHALLGRGLGASDQHAALFAAARHADTAAQVAREESPSPSTCSSVASATRPVATEQRQRESCVWARLESADALDAALGALHQGVNEAESCAAEAVASSACATLLVAQVPRCPLRPPALLVASAQPGGAAAQELPRPIAVVRRGAAKARAGVAASATPPCSCWAELIDTSAAKDFGASPGDAQSGDSTQTRSGAVCSDAQDHDRCGGHSRARRGGGGRVQRSADAGRSGSGAEVEVQSATGDRLLCIVHELEEVLAESTAGCKSWAASSGAAASASTSGEACASACTSAASKREWWDWRHALDARCADVAASLDQLVRGALARVLPQSGAAAAQALSIVLDSGLHRLPWEALPCLRARPVFRALHAIALQPATRMRGPPRSVLAPLGVDTGSTVYVVDPKGDLPGTRQRFEAWLAAEQGWLGSAGAPSMPDAELRIELQRRDLFAFLGHGAGSGALSARRLPHGMPAAVLMGCSSGRLTGAGAAAHTGAVAAYLASGSPCVVANLWDVTDRDIDAFTTSLLSRCTKRPESADCGAAATTAAAQADRPATSAADTSRATAGSECSSATQTAEAAPAESEARASAESSADCIEAPRREPQCHDVRRPTLRSARDAGPAAAVPPPARATGRPRRGGRLRGMQASGSVEAEITDARAAKPAARRGALQRNAAGSGAAQGHDRAAGTEAVAPRQRKVRVCAQHAPADARSRAPRRGVQNGAASTASCAPAVTPGVAGQLAANEAAASESAAGGGVAAGGAGDRLVAQLVAESRAACKLPFLTGFAPVCYGVPTAFRARGER